MAVLKQGGQSGLQKVTEETLQQRLQRMGIPQTTNASMAQGLGATPDQAKMAGASNRKEAVLKSSVLPQQTVAGAADKTQPGQLTQQEQAELAAAERLTKLGGASAQIGQMALDKLKASGQGPTQRQISQSGESLLSKAIDPTTNAAGYNAAKAALVSYANNPADREQALVTLRNLGIQDPETYLERTDQVLNRAVQVSGMTAAEMEPVIQQYGFTDLNDLAVTLGIPAAQLQGLSASDLSNTINQKRQELLDRRVQLQAGAAQTGLAGAAAQQQLQTFTQAGGASREQEAARPTVDMNAKVKVGDDEYDVETILKDEEFSNIIEDWLSAKPEDRANIIPADWPLSSWLADNEAALKASISQGQEAGRQLTEAQKGLSAVKDAPKFAVAAVIPGFDPNRTYSSADIANIQQQWADSKFSKVSPAWLGGLSEEDIKELKKADYTEADLKDMADLATSGDKNVKSFLGLPDKQLYTKNEIDNYKKHLALPEDVKSIINANPKYYKGLSVDDLKKFTNNPTLVREYEEWSAERQKFENFDINKAQEQDLSTLLFGGGITLEQLNTQLTDLKDQERVLGKDYSFAADTNDDGKLSLEELRAYAIKAKDEIAKPKTVDSFTTEAGYADYKPIAPAIDVSKLSPDAQYRVVRDWVDGDSEPSIDNPGDVKLALRLLRSLPDGPTKRALAAKMERAAQGQYIPARDRIDGVIKSILDKPNSELADLNPLRDQAVAEINMAIDKFKNYPQDWPWVATAINILQRKHADLNEAIAKSVKAPPPAVAAPIAVPDLSNLKFDFKMPPINIGPMNFGSIGVGGSKF